MTVEGAAPQPTRERILDVAIQLFADHGYVGTTVSEVERQAGLVGGSGSLYRHFPSKDALLREAVAREVSRLRALLAEAQQALSPQPDPAQRRLQVFELRLRALRRAERLFRLMLNEGERVPELRSAIWDALQAHVRRSPFRDNTLDAMVETALGGYYLFSLMLGHPYRDVEEHDFLSALVALTESRGEQRAPSIVGGESLDPD